MSGYEREINWNLSGKTHSEVQKERRIKELEQQRDELLFVLRDWDGLIEYNYSGKREAMSAMQQCAFDTKAILDKVKP